MIKLLPDPVLFDDHCLPRFFMRFFNRLQFEETVAPLYFLNRVLALVDLVLEHFAHDLVFAFQSAHVGLAAIRSAKLAIVHQLAFLLQCTSYSALAVQALVILAIERSRWLLGLGLGEVGNFQVFVDVGLFEVSFEASEPTL